MRRPLATLALAVTLTLGALPASPAFAAGNGIGDRGGILEIWEALRAGWLGFWSEPGPGVDLNGGSPATLQEAGALVQRGTASYQAEATPVERGPGVDPNGGCATQTCPPPPAAQASTDDPDH
jgi:hypothetical protein